jgi:tetratricopeptide (TPR) repeat protein
MPHANPAPRARQAAPADPAERLATALAELKAGAILPILAAALEALNVGRARDGARLALQVVGADPTCGMAWHVVALCHERAGDLNGALAAYEKAVALDPEDLDLANDLGRLAMQIGDLKSAEGLFRHYVAMRPDHADGHNNLGCALRDQMRYGDALAVLRPAIQAEPTNALLWNTLATVVAEQGDVDHSMVFFDEALRLDPAFAKARYNRANVRLTLGDPDGALEDCEAALQDAALPEPELAMMRFARSTMLLASGRLAEGWDAYEARLDPRHVDVTHFAVPGEPWTPQTPLAGRRLLVVGEQGLGDEVLFANVLGDVVEAVGPEGRLTIAVERRLVPLFQRSFPSATVGPHATYRIEHQSVRAAPCARQGQGAGPEVWAPMASLLRRFRPRVERFPATPAFLRADPERVAHWRAALDALGPGPKVGLVWKSLKINSQRARFFSPFDALAPVLAIAGVRFVNLQYGDCEAELDKARAAGVDIWSAPGLDLKDDLDELAALASALDLAIGPANASLNIAAACGTPAWFVSTPGAWPLLGSDAYPWYPRARVFRPQGFNAWDAVMAEVAGALRQLVAATA